jgi:hypothetical protein
MISEISITTERWFQNKAELADGFAVGDFNQMLVFRHCGGELPFKSFLSKIILDDPERNLMKNVDAYSAAFGALRLSSYEGSIDVPIEKRNCRFGCECKRYYQVNNGLRKIMFDPKC